MTNGSAFSRAALQSSPDDLRADLPRPMPRQKSRAKKDAEGTPLRKSHTPLLRLQPSGLLRYRAQDAESWRYASNTQAQTFRRVCTYSLSFLWLRVGDSDSTDTENRDQPQDFLFMTSGSRRNGYATNRSL